METKTSLTPKYFFLSAGVLISLVTTITSAIMLFFETLNNKFPDALTAVYEYGYNAYSYDGIRSALATLIIFFPIYLVISYFWNKESSKELSRADTAVRRWVIYLILFLSAILIATDLVTLVRYFVSGEITTRFAFKVIGVLIVGGLVGSYYITDLRPVAKLPKQLSKIYAIIGVILVIGLITLSFVVMGSPSKQRALRFDARRLSDLQSIQWQVISYWQQKEKLPETLSVLSTPISSYAVPTDPESLGGKSYEYSVIGPLAFELCADFSLPLPKGWKDYGASGGGIMPMRDIAVSSVYPYGGNGANESWDHEAGRACFTRTIDKDFYPPYPKNIKE